MGAKARKRRKKTRPERIVPPIAKVRVRLGKPSRWYEYTKKTATVPRGTRRLAKRRKSLFFRLEVEIGPDQPLATRGWHVTYTSSEMGYYAHVIPKSVRVLGMDVR